jgi:hypothetical protein
VLVASLSVVAGAAAAHLPTGWASPALPALVAVALVASALSGAVNNLPASAVLSTLLGSNPAVAGAALAGLSAGSLATPHGSVATTLAFERAGAGGAIVARAYLRLWVPTAAAAAAIAATAIWAL